MLRRFDETRRATATHAFDSIFPHSNEDRIAERSLLISKRLDQNVKMGKKDFEDFVSFVTDD